MYFFDHDDDGRLVVVTVRNSSVVDLFVVTTEIVTAADCALLNLVNDRVSYICRDVASSIDVYTGRVSG